MEKLFIPIILGTNRKGRKSEHVANLILQELQKREDVETIIIDVKDFNFPADDYGPNLKAQFPEYVENIKKADGLAIVAPEYNHSYPGSLKTLMDICYEEYEKLAVGIASVSVGPFAGIRLIEHFLPILRGFGLVPCSKDLTISNVNDVFSEDGTLQDEKYLERTNAFLDELIWTTKTLKWGRANA